MKLCGIAPRSWTDKRTGEIQTRKVLWLERSDVRDLVGHAYEEVMIHGELLPAGTQIGDDLVVIRNSSGFVHDVMNLTFMMKSQGGQGAK